MFTGPNIVTDGLVLSLSAASKRSYPGSGTTWYDLSGNNNNATLTNDPTYTNNYTNTFNFDESNDYAIVNNSTLLSKTAYTKIAWFRPESSTANIISGGSSTYGQHAFWMSGTSDSLRAGHNSVWDRVQYSPGDMLNQWWCGAVTFNDSTGWILYLNGEQVDTDSDTTTFSGNQYILIGAYGLATNLFDGDIPIVSVYNRVLTAAEVKQNYNAMKSRFI